jgi:hypothetical protein
MVHTPLLRGLTPPGTLALIKAHWITIFYFNTLMHLLSTQKSAEKPLLNTSLPTDFTLTTLTILTEA